MSFEKFFLKKTDNTINKKEDTPKEQKGVLGKIRDKSRELEFAAAIVAGLSSFGNQVKAETKVGTGTDETKRFKTEVIDSEGKLEFRAINYFKSDSDYISPEAEQSIGYDFQELLSQINESNYAQVMKDGIWIYSSADPEKTNNFKNNKELAEARAESLIVILKKHLGEMNFSNLSPEKAEYLASNIKFFIKVPTSGIVSNPQEGVTYPEDLGYSKEALSKMSEEEIDRIYAECRKVVVSIGMYKSDTYYVSSKDFIKSIPPRNLEI